MLEWTVKTMTDTEKAIEITQRQIKMLESDLKTLVTQEYYDSFNLAIEVKKLSVEALQEKAEREKGCSFCNDKRVVSFCATSYHSSLEPITIIEDLYFKFCPHCGRKLNISPTD